MNTGTPDYVNYDLYHSYYNRWVQDRLTPMFKNSMDLAHELCPAQLLEVTKKSDNLSA